jgi:alpha-amylase
MYARATQMVMDSVTRLVFALHFHQPYGNLDEVFADATDRCYLRTLELLESSPHVRTAIHVSGPLLDWTEAHRPAMIDKLRLLVERGQVEVLGGGYQEPMLAILPDRDAIGQLELMADRCETLLGQRPAGMWLAERVWEPDLARVIAAAGYRYTLLDDSHLRAAGASEPLGEYYVTDKAGASVAVFPIDRGLRTRVPYTEVDKLIAYLEKQKGRAPTYGDDVEKFGLWPTTERRVWGDKWLERFFDSLWAESAWLSTTTPSEILESIPSSGSVYLPTISYQEMGAWTLPPDASTRFVELAYRMRFAGYEDETESFLRGGIWQAFIAKYRESAIIYRKMLRVSAAVERAAQAGHPKAAEARTALYQGQCNCAYWHGLFGGLYLQHLRSALMRALIEAETLIDARETVRLERVDHDGDLQDELLFEGPAYDLYVSPLVGGSAFELDLLDARFPLTGVLGRRREAYHEDVARARVISDEELGNISAHDLVRATEEGLAAKLKFDAYPRGMFVDHLLPPNATLNTLDGDYLPLADLANARHEIRRAVENGEGATAEMRTRVDGYSLTKTLDVLPRALTARYRLGCENNGAFTFCSQIDITLLSPEKVGGRCIEIDGDGDLDPTPGARGIATRVRSVRVACDDLGIDVRITPNVPTELWRLPIETVSQSERGFERSYQGTALVFVWRAEGSELEASLRLDV